MKWAEPISQLQPNPSSGLVWSPVQSPFQGAPGAESVVSQGAASKICGRVGSKALQTTILYNWKQPSKLRSIRKRPLATQHIAHILAAFAEFQSYLNFQQNAPLLASLKLARGLCKTFGDATCPLPGKTKCDSNLKASIFRDWQKLV